MSHGLTNDNLNSFQEEINNLQSELTLKFGTSLPKFYVDAIDMCFLFDQKDCIQQNHDVIDFVEEYFFGTHVCSELYLNQGNVNIHDGEGKLYSCNKDNSYVIDEFNQEEFLIVTHPCALVIDKDAVKEFRSILLKRAIGLCYDENYLTTGKFIESNFKYKGLCSYKIFETLKEMKTTRYLRVVKVGQNMELTPRNSNKINNLILAFRQLRLKNKFLMQFDFTTEFGINNNTNEDNLVIPMYKSLSTENITHGGPTNELRVVEYMLHNNNIDSNLHGGITIKYQDKKIAHNCTNRFLDVINKIRCYGTMHHLLKFKKHLIPSLIMLKKNMPSTVKTLKYLLKKLEETHNQVQDYENKKDLLQYRIEISYRMMGDFTNDKREFLKDLNLLKCVNDMKSFLFLQMEQLGYSIVTNINSLPRLKDIAEGVNLYNSMFFEALQIRDSYEIKNLSKDRLIFVQFLYSTLLLTIGYSSEEHRTILIEWICYKDQEDTNKYMHNFRNIYNNRYGKLMNEFKLPHDAQDVRNEIQYYCQENVIDILDRGKLLQTLDIHDPDTKDWWKELRKILIKCLNIQNKTACEKLQIAWTHDMKCINHEDLKGICKIFKLPLSREHYANRTKLFNMFERKIATCILSSGIRSEVILSKNEKEEISSFNQWNINNIFHKATTDRLNDFQKKQNPYSKDVNFTLKLERDTYYLYQVINNTYKERLVQSLIAIKYVSNNEQHCNSIDMNYEDIYNIYRGAFSPILHELDSYVLPNTNLLNTIQDDIQIINYFLLYHLKLNITRRIDSNYHGKIDALENDDFVTAMQPQEAQELDMFIEHFYLSPKNKLAATFSVQCANGDACLFLGKFKNTKNTYYYEVFIYDEVIKTPKRMITNNIVFFRNNLITCIGQMLMRRNRNKIITNNQTRKDNSSFNFYATIWTDAGNKENPDIKDAKHSVIKKYHQVLQFNLFNNYNFLNVSDFNEKQILKNKIQCELNDYTPVKNHVSDDKNALILGDLHKDSYSIIDLTNYEDEYYDDYDDNVTIFTQEEGTLIECNSSEILSDDNEEEQSLAEESNNNFSCSEIDNSYQSTESSYHCDSSSISTVNNSVKIVKENFINNKDNLKNNITTGPRKRKRPNIYGREEASNISLDKSHDEELCYISARDDSNICDPIDCEYRDNIDDETELEQMSVSTTESSLNPNSIASPLHPFTLTTTTTTTNQMHVPLHIKNNVNKLKNLFSITPNDHQLLNNLTCLKKSMHDTIVTQCDMILKRFDFVRFRPQNWLNDSVVMCILKIICLQSNNRFACEESLNTEILFKSNESDRKAKIHKIYNARKKKNMNNIFSKVAMFFPFNIDNYHWALLIANFKEKTIYLLDSLRMSNLEMRNNHINVIQQYIKEFEIHEEIEQTKWKTKQIINMPYQKNSELTFMSF